MLNSLKEVATNVSVGLYYLAPGDVATFILEMQRIAHAPSAISIVDAGSLHFQIQT